jgi:hypothetical protein
VSVSLLVLTTGAVLVSSLVVVARLGLPGLLRNVLAVFVVGLAHVMLVMLVAGSLFQSLHRGTVVALTLVSAGVLAAVTTIPRSTMTGDRGRPRRVWADLVREWWRAIGGRRGLLRSPWALVIGLLAGAEAAFAVAVAFVMPPYAWDGLSYHLPAVAYWIQQGHIGLTPYWIYSNVYPMNAELTFAWPTLLLGNDTMIDSGQLVFALMGALAVAVIARAMGARRSSVVAAAGLFLLTPIVVQQLNVAYVDVAVTGAFLAAFAFWFCALQALGLVGAPARDLGERHDQVEADQRLATTQFVLGGLAAGMALGTKTVALAYVGVLVVVLAGWLLVAAWRRRISWARAFAVALCFVLPMPVLGTFWYARDWIEYGNPVHPFTLAVGGVELFHGQGTPEQTVLAGMAPKRIAAVAWPRQVWASWTQLPPKYVYDQRLGGLGPAWLFAGLPAFLILAVVAALKRRDLLFALVVPMALVFLAQPERWWSRFTIVTAAAGAIAIAWLVEQLRGGQIRGGQIRGGQIRGGQIRGGQIRGGQIRGGQIRGGWYDALRVAVQMATVGLVLLVAVSGFRRQLLDTSIGVHALRTVEALPAGERTLGRVVYPEFAWVDRIPDNARIELRLRDVSNAWVYPLFGRRLQHHLVMLPDVDDEATVRSSLRRHHAQYAVAVKNGTLDTIARRDPQHYRLFADTGPGRVYTVTN